jgi:hypothetical protein
MMEILVEQIISGGEGRETFIGKEGKLWLMEILVGQIIRRERRGGCQIT